MEMPYFCYNTLKIKLQVPEFHCVNAEEVSFWQCVSLVVYIFLYSALGLCCICLYDFLETDDREYENPFSEALICLFFVDFFLYFNCDTIYKSKSTYRGHWLAELKPFYLVNLIKKIQCNS